MDCTSNGTRVPCNLWSIAQGNGKVPCNLSGLELTERLAFIVTILYNKEIRSLTYSTGDANVRSDRTSSGEISQRVDV